MHYFAKFEQLNGAFFRFDTRIYLNRDDTPGPSDKCIGAIIGKNPGSASYTVIGSLAPLTFGRDRLLPTVKRCFTAAYASARKVPPRGTFVRVWNLFYLCNPKLNQAIQAFKQIPFAPTCDSERQPSPPIVWFAWGSANDDLDRLKARFTTKQYHSAFFFDREYNCTAPRIPQHDDFPQHTQGMSEGPVVKFLATQL